jgi:N-acetylglutamate synthase-like GNAT family acetyltransferase
MSGASPVTLGIGPRRVALLVDPAALIVRAGRPEDAPAIAALVEEHVADGHLLARSREDIALHARRFSVAEIDGRIVGCADLAPLGGGVAEVRSLVVHIDARFLGIGRRLVEAVRRRAAAAGVHTLCAFTHAPAYFVQMGFSIVPHAWLPQKIQADCRACPHFRVCGQYAVALPLAASPDGFVPLVSLHG